MTDFADIDLRIASLLEQVAAPGRKAIARKLGTELRRANGKRIRDNIEPDGGAMIPRQPRARGKGLRARIGPEALRGEKMFRDAGGVKFLRARPTDQGAKIGFAGAMARIMAVHQFGQSDTVTRDPASPRAKYPIREVLGITDADRAKILDLLAAHFAP